MSFAFLMNRKHQKIQEVSLPSGIIVLHSTSQKTILDLFHLLPDDTSVITRITYVLLEPVQAVLAISLFQSKVKEDIKQDG